MNYQMISMVMHFSQLGIGQHISKTDLGKHPSRMREFFNYSRSSRVMEDHHNSLSLTYTARIKITRKNWINVFAKSVGFATTSTPKDTIGTTSISRLKKLDGTPHSMD